MSPTFHPGEIISLIETLLENLKMGDIVVFKDAKANASTKNHHEIVHRIVSRKNGQWYTRGDNNRHLDLEPLTEENFIGKVVAVTRNGRNQKVVNGFPGWVYATLLYLNNWSGLYFKKLFYPLYDAFRAYHRRHPIWQPKLTHFTIHTEEHGNIIKILHNGKTIAWYWLRTGTWFCKKPFDLVLVRPPFEEMQLPHHEPGTD